MSKEVEYAINRLMFHKEYAQLSVGTTCIVNKADLEIILKYIEELEKERDGIYADYQDLGKEYSKLEDRNKELETGEIEKTNLKIAELEYKLSDSTANLVIREKLKELKAKSGGDAFHIQQTINAEIGLLEEILEGEKE